MSEHLLERGKAIRRGKGNREGVTKIDEGSSRKEKGRWETRKSWERWERGWACRGCRKSSAKTASIRGPRKVVREVLAWNRRNCR